MNKFTKLIRTSISLVRHKRRLIISGSIAGLLASVSMRSVYAVTTQTWDGGSLVDAMWSTLNNWLSGTPPGSTSSTTNTDIALFNAPIANTWGNSVSNPIVIDSGRNIGGINFDAAAGNYFIGSTAGNALNLTSGGAVQILSTLTATNAVQTINAPLVIEGSNYAFANNSANGSGVGAGTLNVGGGITGSSGSTTTLILRGANTNANTVSGVIANGAANSFGVAKTGAGTWVLNAANTYSGATSINGGTLVLSFGTVLANILPSGSALTLSGGTLQLTGTGIQTVNGLTINNGNQILLGANETLTLGGLTSAGAGSALNFNTSAGGANADTSALGTSLIVLTGQTAGNAINPGFTVSDTGGFGLATVNVSNQVVRLTTTALLPASGAMSSTDYRINNNNGGPGAAGSSSLNINTSETVNSLTVDTTAAAGTLTLDPGGVVLSSNTWNFGGAGTNTWQMVVGSFASIASMSTSGITSGITSATSGATIIFNNYNAGAVTISAPILANGTNSVIVHGTGTLIFAGANTYTGNTQVQGGTLQIPSGGSISGATLIVGVGTGAALNITGGSVSATNSILGSGGGSFGTATMSSGTWTNSGNLAVGSLGTGVLNLSGGNISDANGFVGSSVGSTGTANISGGTWTNSSALTIGGAGSGVLNLTGSGSVTVNSGAGTLVLASSPGSSGTLNVGTGGVAGTLSAAAVFGGTATAMVNFNHTGNYTFAPQLAGSLSVNKTGSGTTVLTNTNTYTGPTTVSAGTLLVSGSISGSTATVSGSGSTLGGTGTVGGVGIANGAILEGGDGTAASGTLTSGGNIMFSTGAIIELALGPAGVHSSLARTGGTWSFDNTQTFAFTNFGMQPTTYNQIITGLAGTETGLSSIGNWTISTPGVVGTFFYDGAGNVDLTLSAIPEPGSAALLFAGLPLLGWRRRRIQNLRAVQGF